MGGEHVVVRVGLGHPDVVDLLVVLGEGERVGDLSGGVHGLGEEEADLGSVVIGDGSALGCAGPPTGAGHEGCAGVVLLPGALEESDAALEEECSVLADACLGDVVVHQADGLVEVGEDESCDLVAGSALGSLGEDIHVIGEGLGDDGEVAELAEPVVVLECAEEVSFAEVLCGFGAGEGPVVESGLYVLDEVVERVDAGEAPQAAGLGDGPGIFDVAVVGTLVVVGGVVVVVGGLSAGAERAGDGSVAGVVTGRVVAVDVCLELGRGLEIFLRRDLREGLLVEELVAGREGEDGEGRHQDTFDR